MPLTTNRHDPAVIERVGELLDEGLEYADIAKALDSSERTIARIVEENAAALAPTLARVRVRVAQALVVEGQAILDAPLPAENASAEATRARNRADFRWNRAAAEHREKYGEHVQHDIKAVVALVAFPDLTPRPLAAVAVDPSLPVAPLVPEAKYEPA